MDSKLIGDPLANRRGKLDCITSFFSLPLLLLEAITGASLEDSGLIWVWHFCPVQLWSSCLEAKCVSSHRSEAWWTALKEVKLGIVRYSPMVTFPMASLQKSVSSSLVSSCLLNECNFLVLTLESLVLVICIRVAKKLPKRSNSRIFCATKQSVTLSWKNR